MAALIEPHGGIVVTDIQVAGWMRGWQKEVDARPQMALRGSPQGWPRMPRPVGLAMPAWLRPPAPHRENWALLRLHEGFYFLRMCLG